MKILKILGIVICIAIVLFVVLGILPIVRTMHPAPEGAVIPGVYAFNQKMVDFFIIKDNKDLIAIDSGLKPDTLAANLKKQGLSADDVKIVFLTHSDRDHIGGLPAFKNAKIYLPAEEEQMVNGTTKRKLFGSERFNSLPQKHILFKDGEVFKLGGISIKGISTPGHTMGSMTFLVDGKWLFTGDMAILKAGKLRVTPESFNNDTALSEKSLKKLAGMIEGVELVCTSHSGCTMDIKKAFSELK
jgi:hydroxyacylglutathione hydrolase